MKDLKFEQKRSLSRAEAADQLTALADALRQGGEAELELGSGTLSLRIPDELRCELEFEVSGGEIELEIEFKWPTGRARKSAPAKSAEPAGSTASKTTAARTTPGRAAKKTTAATSATPAKRASRKTSAGPASASGGGRRTKRAAAKQTAAATDTAT
ncbi:amphi-Trp domain-containing protein [Streptomyces sp. TX20-6-3]|uniref:amphi-Trp domain-containing protein n=1 Tax=Streptomyces sp. TX20-6-3 TaxID=3028705 RepID=UPI0029BEACA2|nr:amphi-Trp domain-containing protein [Streptomyces sp. TX20-6-3]MDX2558864.1 amphi-Trp domain-containing protein [Streptomyces sp. TX20-6-3]